MTERGTSHMDWLRLVSTVAWLVIFVIWPQFTFALTLNQGFGKNMSPPQLNLRNVGNLGVSHTDRDTVLDQSIPDICAEWFPDNEDNTWHIERTVHIDDRIFVLAKRFSLRTQCTRKMRNRPLDSSAPHPIARQTSRR